MPNPDKRQLSARDIEQIHAVVSPDLWPEPKLRLIWSRCIPAEAALEDFQYFLYSCQARGLDPLLSESYLRLQWDKATSSMKPVIIVGIGGALKTAHSKGYFDGMKTTFEKQAGTLVSATTLVWRKGCSQPFEATVYYSEYVATNKDGKPVYMWESKPHIMLGKVSEMAALRKAFAAELAGTYVEEEFDRKSPEPEANFVVEDVGKAESAGKSVHETPTSEARREAKSAAEPQPEALPPQERNNLNNQLSALKQRICTDLNIPVLSRKQVTSDYFRGFLKTTALPKASDNYIDALDMLDCLATYSREQCSAILVQPSAFGTLARREYDTWFDPLKAKYGWSTASCVLAYRVARLFQYDGLDQLEKYVTANNLAMRDEADVAAFLRLALVDRNLAAAAADKASESGTPVADLVIVAEGVLRGKLETFSLAPIQAAFDSLWTEHR